MKLSQGLDADECPLVAQSGHGLGDRTGGIARLRRADHSNVVTAAIDLG